MAKDKMSLTRDEAVQLSQLLGVTAELCQRCGDNVNMGRARSTINLITERLEPKPEAAQPTVEDGPEKRALASSRKV